MSRIRGKDTGIERLVRRELHQRGFRFRLHRRDLPGSPDLVLPKFGAVVFVNGCFWHAHGCQLSSLPSSNRDFWTEKLKGTIGRDQRVQEELLSAGWRVATVWECELRGRSEAEIGEVGDRLVEFLLDPHITELEVGPKRRVLAGLV
jgi:DNA mismatch endonuclease (patch repair protein)